MPCLANHAPPRRPRSSVPFVDGQAEPLHHELELSLLFGRGSRGIPVELHHVDGWRRAWAEHRGTIDAKAREHLPGVRPMAAYVTGELPAPPVLSEPPLCHRFYRQWIAGTGRFWTRYPEPWQRDETSWLVELGVVDSEELERHRKRIRRGSQSGGSAVWRLLGSYQLEIGLYV